MDSSPFGYDIDCGSGNLSAAEETYCTLNPEQHGEADLQNTVGNALNTVFFWVGIIAVIFIIVASINLVISAGSPDKVKKSKNSIMYAVAGLVIVLMSFAITNFTLNALQGKVEESGGSGESSSQDGGSGGSGGGQGGNQGVDQGGGSQDGGSGGSNRRKVEYISVVKSTKLVIGQTASLKAKAIPTNADNTKLSYTSSNKNVASVNANGQIKALSEGTATITVTSADGPKASVLVQVVKPVAVESILVSEKTIKLRKGKTKQIKATVAPSNAANKTLTWITSNKKVVTVTQTGQIKAIDKGEATITIKANDDSGVTMTIKVTVPSETYEVQETSTMNKKAPKTLDFTEPTRKIVWAHTKDFKYSNFTSFMNSHGGYTNYVKSLGGIFTTYAGKSRKFKIKTAADFQAAAEYFWGLFTMWGIDYGAGNREGGYHLWGKGSSDGFYAGASGRYPMSGNYTSSGDIDDMLANSTNGKARTNCNSGINVFLRKTNLKRSGVYGGGSQWAHHARMSKVGKITKTEDLRVGDIVHFFNGSGDWNHVAIVGEVYSDYVILYDAGSRFIKSKHYKHKVKRGSRSMTGEYSNCGTNWFGARLWDIDQNITLEGL